MFGSVTRQNRRKPPAPSEAAASSVAALRLHQRDQFAGDEGEGHEHRGQHDAGRGEQDLDVVRLQPRAEPAVGAEQQHQHEAGDDRRDRERQVDEGQEEPLAAELELGHRPGGGEAEHGIQWNGDGRHGERERDGRPGVGLVHRRPPGLHTLRQGLDQHDQQRQQNQRGHQADGQQDQQHAQPTGFVERRVGPRPAGISHDAPSAAAS